MQETILYQTDYLWLMEKTPRRRKPNREAVARYVLFQTDSMDPMHKLKGMGHIVKWARANHELPWLAKDVDGRTSQPKFALMLVAEGNQSKYKELDFLVKEKQPLPDEVRAKLLNYEWLIKNGERNRQHLPLSFVDLVGRASGFDRDWVAGVPGPPAEKPDSGSHGRPQVNPPIEVPQAPKSRIVPLRTSHVINKAAWRRVAKLPHFFTFPGYLQGDDDRPGYPIFFADLIEPDEEIFAPFLRSGDLLGVRSDLEIRPGKMVLATSKAGKPVRGQLTAELAIRRFDVPDVPLSDVAAYEGIICGRFRVPSAGGAVSAVWDPEGLTLDDL